MSTGVSIIIRPPPHTDFVRGYPGIAPSPDGSRGAAFISGTVEVRPKPKGVKAIWLRLELRKLEQIPGNKATSRYREHIGSGPLTLWQSRPRGKAKAGEVHYDVLMNSDWPFSIPLPEGLPPSVLIDSKNGLGVHYELTATMLVKPKSGMLSSGSKEPVLITEATPIVLEKHDLHPAWPVYSYKAQMEDRKDKLNGINMSVKRQTIAYGPGDPIIATVRIKSERLDPLKFSRLELVMREIITYRGDIKDPSAAGQQRTNDIVEARQWINKALYSNEEHTITIRGIIPPSHSRVTCSTAKHVGLTYSVGVRAVFERERGTSGQVADIVLDHMPAIVSSYSLEQSKEVVAAITAGGHIPDELASRNPQPLRASVLGSTSPSSDGGSGDMQRIPSHNSAAAAPPFRLHTADGIFRTGTPPLASLPAFHSQGHAARYQAPAVDSAILRQTHPGSNSHIGVIDEHGNMRGRQSVVLVEAAKQRLADRTNPAVAVPPAISAVAPSDSPGSPAPNDAPAPWETAEAEKRRLRESMRVVNASEDVDTTAEAQERLLQQQATSSTSIAPPSRAPPPPSIAPTTTQWPAAADEKRKLYEEAVRARGEEPETDAAPSPPPPMPDQSTRPPSIASPAVSPAAVERPRPSWPTAAEEKERLYQQATVARQGNEPESATPGQASGSTMVNGGDLPAYASAGEEKERLYNSAISHRPSERAAFPRNLGSEQSAVNAYQAAIAERERWLAEGGGSTSLPTPQPGEAGPSSSTSKRPVPAPPSATDEKAALAARYKQEELASSTSTTASTLGRRTSSAGVYNEERMRYEEAVAAREAVQAALDSPPGSPPAASSASKSNGPPGYAAPAPPASAGANEKEQMARYHAAQEAVAARQKQRSASPPDALPLVAEDEELPPSFASIVPPPANGGSSSSAAASSRSPPRAASAAFTSALSEKEAMARFYASQGQAEAASSMAPTASAAVAHLPGAYVGSPVASPDLANSTNAAAPLMLPLDYRRQSRTPDYGGNPLAQQQQQHRRPSTAESSSENGDAPIRDPSIALGKRRADPSLPSSPSMGSAPLAFSPPSSMGGMRQSWSQGRTSIYGYGLAGPTWDGDREETPVERLGGQPPPRPPKTPLGSYR